MRKRWIRVARPPRTSTRRVPSGASVPACPTRLIPSARRTAATMSCEVLPAGLSMRRTPSTDEDDMRVGSAGGRSELRGDLRAQERDDLVGFQLRGEAGRLAVPAAA